MINNQLEKKNMTMYRLSKESNVPLCEEYDSLRKTKLKEPIYPASIIVMSEAAGNDEAKKEAVKNSIPEFRRHNIIESEVRNIV